MFKTLGAPSIALGRLRDALVGGAVPVLSLVACVASDPPSGDESGTAGLGSTKDGVWDRGTDAATIPVDSHPWLVHTNSADPHVRSCGGALVASNVILTAKHCGEIWDVFSAANITTNVELRDAIDHLAGGAEQRISPWSLDLPPNDASEAGGNQGMDVVLIVYPEDRAIPRRHLTPGRIALAGSAANPGRLLSHRKHTTDCATFSLTPTYVQFDDAVMGLDDNNDLPIVEYDSPNSHICRGDSGSPVVAGAQNHLIVSLMSTISDGEVGSSDMKGPWLAGSYLRSWLAVHGVDRDRDGKESFEDNCDTVPNPSQLDSDQDGTGNACDPCPLTPFESLDWTVLDPDADGFANCAGVDECPLDGMGNPTGACADTERGQSGDSDCDGLCDSVDACASVPNFDLRENSNADAEARWGAAEVPDACEPVLVPRGAVDSKYSTSLGLSSVNTTFFDAVTWIQTDDRVNRQHMPSRNIAGGSPEKVDVASVVTNTRFCQPDATINCLASSNIDEARLTQAPTALTELPTHPYHRVTVGTGSRGASALRTYDNKSESLTWAYESDETFWTANGIVDVPPAETHPTAPGVEASGLDGVMWFHADSTVGHPGSSANNVGTGVHLGPASINDTAQLSSSYFAIDPESIRHTQKHRPLELAIPRFAWRDLPRWPDIYRDLFWGVDSLDHLAVFETTDHQFGYLTADGMIQPLTELLSAALQARLAENRVWAKAEESWSHFAAPDSPTAVVLDVGGTEIVDRIVLGPDGLSFDVAGPPAATPVFPAAVSDFLAVYARSLGAVFRVGGTYQIPTGSFPAGVWRFDAATGQAFELDVPFPLGAVKAASFDAVTRELVVLHEETKGSSTSISLVRIDALGRGARRVKSWARDGDCTNLWLTVDGRGRTVLSANLGAKMAHEMYSLEGEGLRFVSRRLHSAAGTLVTQPWSNEKRFYVPVQSSPTTGAVTVGSLGLSTTGTVVDVSACL